jgi:hypothetical protein
MAGYIYIQYSVADRDGSLFKTDGIIQFYNLTATNLDVLTATNVAYKNS